MPELKTRREFIEIAAWLPGVAVAQAKSSDRGGFPLSKSELDAGVTPMDLRYPVGNVMRYGAAGDGQADDSVAVSNALLVVKHAKNGLVILPADHVFKITSYIRIFANTTLHLLGRLQLTGRSSGLYMDGAADVGIYGFKNGTISDANVAADYRWNPGSGNIAPAIHIRSSSNVMVDGITIRHCSQGVFVSNAAENFVTDAPFSPNQAYPVNVKICNCDMRFCEWSGCATLSSQNSGYYNNYVYRCGDSGMWMMGAVDGEIVSNHRVSPASVPADCLIHGYNNQAYPTTWNDEQGISLQGCRNVQVSSNVVSNFWAQGIDIKDACDNIIVSNNRISNCEQASIIVREGDSGNVAACHKVSIISNTISGHGTLQFNLDTGAHGAIHSSSCFLVEIANNVIYSYRGTPGINCLGPGSYNDGMYRLNPQQSSLTISGNTIAFKSVASEGGQPIEFDSGTPGAIVIKGEYTSVKCDSNHIRTDRYYFADSRINAAPAIMLQYVEANSSCYPASASVNSNEISGWGFTGISVIGLPKARYSGLTVNSNSIANVGGYGIYLEAVNHAVCNSNSIVQNNNSRHSYEGVLLTGSVEYPLTGVVCSGNAVSGAWSVGGNSMSYCMSLQYAADINLCNNQLGGARLGNLFAHDIKGNVFLQGTTGFPRSGAHAPDGIEIAFHVGEMYFERTNSRWWVANEYQATAWRECTLNTPA